MSTDIAAKLTRAGMAIAEAQNKARLFERIGQALGTNDDGEILRYHVPGRIEVLGKHTDYAGGRSLLCAAEQGICIAARRRPDTIISVADVVHGETTRFHFSADLAIPSAGWEVYPKTVARRIARNFQGPLLGAAVAFGSDLPRAAGMSSSSALVVAMFTALAIVNQLDQRDAYRLAIQRPEDLAEYLGCIENGQTFRSLAGDRGVGTFGGSEDHTAILNARPRHLVQYSFCPVRLEGSVKLPDDCIFVIAISGVVADKTGSARDKYNRASRAAQAVLEAWQSEAGSRSQTLAAAISSLTNGPETIRAALLHARAADFDSPALLRRFEQFFLESETFVPQASAALARGDLKNFGDLVEGSQQAAEELLGNQVGETMSLVRNARMLGAYAASAFGAGFGGSVWALVERDHADAFANQWRDAYLAQYPEHTARSQFFATSAGPPLIHL